MGRTKAVDIQPLVAKKEFLLGQLEKIWALAQRLPEESAADDFFCGVLTLNDMKIEFEQVIDQINVIKSSQGEKCDFSERETFNNLYGKIKRVESNLQVPKVDGGIDGAKIPDLDLPHFDGDMKSWPVFRDTFTRVIHNNPKVSRERKVQYLVGRLSGKALATVSALPVTGDYYEAIWELLLEKYQDANALARTCSICENGLKFLKHGGLTSSRTGRKHLYDFRRSSSWYPDIVTPRNVNLELRRAMQTADRRRSTFTDRGQLKYARRLVVKLGSAVITREDEHGIALGRLASIVEQVAECYMGGRECIMVTSGAVAFGKQKLTQELVMSLSMRETLSPKDPNKEEPKHLLEPRAAAAVGQSGLMSLYDAMFAQYGVKIAQVLVTKPDFYNEETRRNLFSTLSELISLNIVPIINTNDAVTPPPQVDDEIRGVGGKKAISLKDNDSLAAMLAAEIQADLLILMSDVDGMYTKPPSQEGARLIHTYNAEMREDVQFGVTSKVGTGGMDSKVQAATWALDRGVSVVICNGMQEKAIKTILAGRKIGTFFTDSSTGTTSVEVVAENARVGSRQLLNLTAHDRANCIHTLADLLVSKQSAIIQANNLDLEEARKQNLAKPLLSRLSLSPSKIKSLSTGLKQIADASLTNVHRVLRKTKIAEGLELTQITVPIGVLLVIFESRPDALPQVAALAISTANGLLLKGGKEASHSNKALMELVREALETVGAPNAVSLVSTREEISDLLSMEDHIDLIIPRGSTELVRSIQEQSQHIPVLGHAEGVCHVYVDKDSDYSKALKIVRDSKCDYPAACNAMETLLIHEDLINESFFADVCAMLKKEGVKINSGPKLSKILTFGPPPAKSLKTEYGSLECCIEVVKNLDEAIEHIHTYGSGHTEVIVTEDRSKADKFQREVDSACVFHNASSRFADGYRFGLGAEVGISTARIHARGPVGVEGLLTTKWVLNGEDHVVSEFVEGGPRQYLHENLPF